MPLSFLAPVFLAGLAALAIPVLIHLAHRPKKQVVRFPSLMFLDPVEYRDASRRRLRDLVLFALRSLAIILLVAAFARPFLDRPGVPAAGPEGGREIVILMDRSESMGIGDRMERARAAVAGEAAGLRRGDRATLIAFDREAAALNRATDEPAVLERAARGVRPGAGGTRFLPALRLAESLLSGTPLPRAELVILSDFQRVGWSPDDVPSMPPGTEIRTVAVGEPVPNLSVTDVAFSRERFSGRDRVRVAASVAGLDGGDGAGDGAGEVAVELVLDGRTVQTRSVAVPAGGASVEFDPVTLPDRGVRGVVRAGTDAMPGDNDFHFVLSTSRALRVLLVVPRSGRSPYLERALTVGTDVDVAALREDRLADASLAGVDVVALEGEPDEAGLRRLEGWVRAGGGLVAALGPGTRARSWSGVGLLPGTVGGIRDTGDDGAALTDLALSHPALEPLRPGPAALTTGRVYRYRELEPDDGSTVLARHDGGHPAVAAREVGAGRVVALAWPLNDQWTDLALQPGFVPFVHGLVRHAAGREAAPAWRRVGELLEPAALLGGGPVAAGDDPGAVPVLLTPGNDARTVRSDSLYALTERGFYELRDPRTGAEPMVVAVNGDPAESDPSAVEPEEVRRAVDGGPAGAMTASFAAEDRERRQSLWWYVLAAAFVLMAVESVLSNVLSRRRLPRAERG